MQPRRVALKVFLFVLVVFFDATTRPRTTKNDDDDDISVGIHFFVSAIESEFYMDWESGFPDGSPVLDPAQEPSFSLNQVSDVATCRTSGGNEITECKCGVNGYSPRTCETYYGNSSLHSQTVVTGVNWARKGTGVLKYYADGRELGTQSSVPSGKYALNRCELGTIPYRYDAGDDVYYTASFYLPSRYWDESTLYSIIITQWKITDNPHGALRVSNLGDYKLYYEGGSLVDNTEIGTAKPDAWNDVKIYYKKSLSSDGRIRIYLNGAKVFEHEGKNMFGRRSDGSGGYLKFGMYTEIRSERVIYFDAVSMTSGRLPTGFTTEQEWVDEHLHLPTATLAAPANSLSLASGDAISLTADASDPGSAKLGIPGGISKVEWHVHLGSKLCKIAEATSSPFGGSWAPPEDGTYVISASAIDSDGNIANTTKNTVYVGNRAPEVTIDSPGSGTALPLTGATLVRVSVSDPDGGTIAFVTVTAIDDDGGVVFAQNASFVSAGVYQVEWTPSSKDGYAIYAKARDNGGKDGTSAYVNVVAGATTGSSTLTAIDDAALKGRTSDRDQNNNYGSVELWMREEDETDGEQSIVSVFKFDASSLATFAEIRSAKLRLYVNQKSGDSSDYAVYSTVGSEAWVEESVTWNNGPKKKDKIAVTFVSSAGEYHEWDVTTHIDAVVKSGSGLDTVTFWVEGNEAGDGGYGLEFDSWKRTNQPKLVVTWSDLVVPSIAAPPASTACPVEASITNTSPPPSQGETNDDGLFSSASTTASPGLFFFYGLISLCVLCFPLL